MIRCTTNGQTMTISGMNPEIPRSEVKGWLEDVAELTDERIAEDWRNERLAGRKMPANEPETDERKAREGLDMGVGTATGNLQDHLDRGGYWKIGAISNGRASIQWDESALQADVEYAEYLAELKGNGRDILTVLQKDCRVAEEYLRDREADWQRANRRDTNDATGRSRRVQGRRAGLGASVRVG